MRLEALISGLAVEVVRGGGAGAGGGAAGAAAGGAVEIKGLTEDSRAVGPGWLFVARRGEKSDGRKFVAQAVERGAAAVLSDDAGLAVPGGAVGLVVRGEDRGESGGVEGVSAVIAERFYGEPTRRLAVCGVTGTNGKTTTTFLVHQIMNGAGRRCGLVGTVQIDDGAGVVPAVLTTPPAMELSRTFARMVEHGCVAAAIEASSHALSQRRVAAVKFRAAGFTNLTQDHLDYHGTMEAYAAAKAELFAMLEPGGIAVMNAQDPWTPRMLRDVRAGVEVWGCAVRRVGGAGESGGEEFARAAWRGTVHAMGPWGMELEVEGPKGIGPWRVRLPLPGEHNAMNALQAGALAVALGASAAEVERGLAGVEAPPGRLQPVVVRGVGAAGGGVMAGPTVYVDYAHTDDALERALAACRELLSAGGAGGEAGTRGRLVCVFGCGGDRDRSKRPKMGAAAARGADVVVITSDNPRTERPGAIIEEIVEGVKAVRGVSDGVRVEEDRQRAIEWAIESAGAGDIVLIAGKGHETYQIMPDGRGGTVKRDFDDRLVAAGALRAWHARVGGVGGVKR